MVWFFGKNKDKNGENNHNNQKETQSNQKPMFTWKTSSSFSSKKRICQNDPNDNHYMICKTFIKDNNGTRQEEERIPINNGYSSSSSSSSSYQHSSSLGSGIFSPYFGHNNESPTQAQCQEQKVFNNFPSFFNQPSFFDFHNTNPQNSDEHHIKSYSYGSKKTCVRDPEDNEYMICKSQINNGGQTKQLEQRVKVREIGPNTFSGLSGLGIGKQFMNIEKQLDKQINSMMKDINSGIGYLLPFMSHLSGFVNAMNPQNFQNRNHSFQHQQPIHDS